MTREEAIKMLEYIRHTGNGESEYKNDAQAIAIDMAIKALEREPCEDCISRQAALEIAESSKSNWIDNSVLFKRVNELPSVNPKPKTGRWVKHDTGHSVSYECSRCSCAAPCMETADSFIWKLSKFCPDCGAKMESEGKQYKVEYKAESEVEK